MSERKRGIDATIRDYVRALQKALKEKDAEHAAALAAARAEEREKIAKLLEIQPYSEEWEAICEEGYAEHHKQMRGARGQTVTPMDNPEYWICRAFAAYIAAAIRTTEQEGEG